MCVEGPMLKAYCNSEGPKRYEGLKGPAAAIVDGSSLRSFHSSLRIISFHQCSLRQGGNMVLFYGYDALRTIWKNGVKFASTLDSPESFISKDDLALLIAVHYNWNRKKIRDELQASRDTVYAQIGLCLAESTIGTCCICVSENTAEHPACGHACKAHLQEYLVMEVEAGKAKLRCPNHVDCHVNHLSSSLHDEKVIARFDTNVGRSWVYAMKRWTTCPLVGCSVVRLDDEEKTTGVVTCVRCTSKFCFQCKINHFPASCEDNHNWSKRSFGDGIKPCPNCKAKTSKIDGCLHMVCEADGCGHEYCWSCLKVWSSSHAFYQCSSAENFGGNDTDVIQCEKELRFISELRRELYYCSHSDDAATTELLKSHILEDESLLDYDILTGELIKILNWFSIFFRYHPNDYHPNERRDFWDDVKKVTACIRENLDKYPKLEEMPTTPREPIAARTEYGKNLIEELYSKFKVDCIFHMRKNMSD